MLSSGLALVLWWLLAPQGASAAPSPSPPLSSSSPPPQQPSQPPQPPPPTPPSPPPSPPSPSPPSPLTAPPPAPLSIHLVGIICAVCIVVYFAGIYAAVMCLHNWKKEAVQVEVASIATRAAHGADERAAANQGEESPPPRYSQMVMLTGQCPSRRSSSAEQVVPVGLPVAASADGSWVPASGGGRIESGSGLELSPAVVTGLVLPNV